MAPETKVEVRLGRLLSVVGGIAAVLVVLGILGSIVRSDLPLLAESPGVVGLAAGLGLIALLAWFGAADVRRFRWLIRLLVGDLVLGVLILIALLLRLGGTAHLVELLAGAVSCGVVALVVGATLARTKPIPPVLPWATDKPITGVERAGQVILGVFGAALLVLAAALLALGVAGAAPSLLSEPLLAGGLILKTSLLGALALLAAADVRRHATALTLVILASIISFVTALASLRGAALSAATVMTLDGGGLTLAQLQRGVLVADTVVVVVGSALWWLMGNARLDYLGYVWPFQFRTIEALADVLVADTPEKVPSYQVALTLDRYLSSFASNRLVLTRLAVIGLELAPLAWLQTPFSILSPAARRRFLDLRYKQNLTAKEGRTPLLDLLRSQLQGAMRIGMQGVYIGSYSDRRSQQAIGYTPFSQRYADYLNIKPRRKYPPLTVTTPDDVRRLGLDVITSADVVIVGSGAAGSILAEQLLAQGHDVILLEKGLYVDPNDFTEDEVHQIGRLYADGALQVSQSYRFQILQGNCVGGGTVVNNAVCFETPDRILQAWNDPRGANAGIDVEAYRRSQELVKQRLAIQSIKTSSATIPWPDVLNHGDRVIAQGVEKIGLKPGDEFDVVRANITDCLGCGYCNIGCKFGRKLSMLDEVLPKAQHEHGPDRFRIFSEAQAVKLNGAGRKIVEIVVQLRDGRRLLIRDPKTVVVSAGTIASSWLLMRSGIGRGELPVGRHVCFNMGSPLHGYWPPTNGSHLDSFVGLQIAHYLELADHPGFVFETWFNPPVAQAMTMPGWLDQHERNMRRYRDLSAVGVLVGTETNAYVVPATILRGYPDVVYQPSERDLKTLIQALIMLGEIMFAGGAEEVLPAVMSYRRLEETIFRRPEDLQRLYKIVQDDRDIVLGTGHPQGGNAISKIRGNDRGVIDPEFAVYGYDNLHVCDGSVFPSPTTVNPQLSIMTMAHYAAQIIGSRSK